MELKNNKNTIIKETDKGGSVVIMSRKHCKMVQDHLNNNQIYKTTDSTCDNKVMSKIKN